MAEADALEKVAAAAVSLEDYPSDDETTAPPHHPKVVGDSYLSGSGGSRRPHGAQNYEQVIIMFLDTDTRDGRDVQSFSSRNL